MVEYGGQTYSANVRMIGVSPTIRNSVIRNGSQAGIYGTSSPPSPTIQGNTFSGNASNYDVFFDGGSATVTGNTLYNFTSGGMVSNTGDLGGHTWSGNTFFGDSTASAWRYNTVTTFSGWRTLTGFSNPGTYAGSTLSGVKIVVRPNHYEPSRANIIVYNWAQQSTVSVDVSGILNVGDHYVVQNAQDFYGTPATSGTYDGSPLHLPIAGITPPTPLGRAVQAAPVTGPTFNVFVLMRTP